MHINIADSSEQPIEENFFFEPIPNKLLEEKEYKQIMAKWGLMPTLQIGSFRFNQPFHETDIQSFLKDLFSNPNVRFLNNKIEFPVEAVSEVHFESLRSTQLSTEMFDVLEKEGVVTKDMIHGTYGDFFEGIQICNKLRQCLLVEESETYLIFDDHQRKQLLFKIFQCLVIGGSLNQYDDNINPYLEWTKKIYKSVVAVRKQPQSENIFIESKAYRIKGIDKTYKEEYNPQKFVYVVVNPSIRVVHVLSNTWEKFW